MNKRIAKKFAYLKAWLILNSSIKSKSKCKLKEFSGDISESDYKKINSEFNDFLKYLWRMSR